MASAPHRAHASGLQTLIEAGADLNVQVSESIRLSLEVLVCDKQDTDGCTPLTWAVHNNHYGNAQILLLAGAKWLVSPKSCTSFIPHLAFRKNILDVKGRTALQHAMSSKMALLFGDAEVQHL